MNHYEPGEILMFASDWPYAVSHPGWRVIRLVYLGDDCAVCITPGPKGSSWVLGTATWSLAHQAWVKDESWPAT